jgi:hypothetical protein
MVFFSLGNTYGQLNLALSAVSSHSGGGASPSFGPENYNDGFIPAFGCTSPCGWGWVTSNGWIEFQWTSPVRFNGVKFFKDNRPMTACIIQSWNGTGYDTIVSYSNPASPNPEDSIFFTPVTSTRIRFNAVAGSNPNFREIQVFAAPSANQDAGISTILRPLTFCPNSTDSIVVRVQNFGTNQINSVTINYEVNGVLQAPVFHSTLLDTFGGSGANFANVVLNPAYFFGTGAFTIKAWTSSPNGLPDTVNTNDTSTRTVNSALAGTITVGGVGATYPTLAAAASALSAAGVCGPVVINVDSAAGPYTGQVVFSTILGASAVNTVKINGNGAVIQATHTTSNIGVIRLSNASFLTIDRLNIISQATNTGTGILLTAGSNFNTIQNCVIDISANLSLVTTSAGIALSGTISSAAIAGNSGSFDTIRNNIIRGAAGGGPYYGITLYGSSTTLGCQGNVVENNEIVDFGFYGITLSNAGNNLIVGNNIHKPNRTNFTTFSGVTLLAGATANRIERNRIHNPCGGFLTSTSTLYGLFVSGADATAGSENIFANNLIYNMNGNGTLYGVYNVGSDGTYFYHNTVSLDAATATTGVTRGFFQTTLATNIQFLNNIVTIRRGGTGAKHAVYFGTTTSTIACNNNAYFLGSAGTGAQHIGFFTSDVTTFAAWQAANSNAYDQNSVNADPIYANPASFLLIPTSGSVNNVGAPLTQVPLDFLGTTRGSAPDPGGYEFSPSSDDVGMVAIVAPSSGCGLSASTQIRVRFRNNGVNSVASASVSYSINGGTPVTEFYGGTLAPSQDTVFSFTTTANLSTPGFYSIVAWVQAAGDQFALNDTLARTVQSLATIASFPYTEGFESGAGIWAGGGAASSWSRSTPAGTVINSAGGGSFSWVTNPTGLYNPLERSFVLSECFNFSSLTDPRIEMKVWWNTEANWDGAQLQSSIDGGQTWQRVGIANDPNGENWYNNGNTFSSADVATFLGNQQGWWSGRTGGATLGSGGWRTAKNRLTGLAGQSGVRLRIAFGSDGSGQDDGFAFDDLVIGDPPQVDAGVVALVPGTFCAGNTTLAARVRNFGVQALTSFNLSIEVNGSTVGTASFTGSLPNGADTVISVGSFNFMNNTPYSIRAFTSSPNGGLDGFVQNDTLRRDSVSTSLSGTYTLGGSGANFANFTALANALSQFGVCGPVIVNVDSAAGPYVGQVTFGSIVGASAVNSIIINGNGATLEASPTATNRAIILLNGADHMTFSRLRVRGLSSLEGYGFLLQNASDFNTITNCEIDLSAITSTSSFNSAGIASSNSLVNVTTDGNNANYLTIENNLIRGGASGGPFFGIYLNGNGTTGAQATNCRILNNTLRDFYSQAILLDKCDSAWVIGNDISKPTISLATTFYGVYSFGTIVAGVRIEKNRIYKAFSGAPGSSSLAYGVWVSHDAPASAPTLIVNNLIYELDNASGTIYGIYNSGGDNCSIYHNTISHDLGTSSGIIRGFFQTTLATGIEFRNNIVSVSKGGSSANKHCIYFGTPTSGILSNNNVFHVGSTLNSIGFFNSTQATLAAWQSASSQDAFSVSANPQFANLPTGALSPTAGAVNNIGASIPSVPDDFFGTTRGTNPDPGAIEFSPVGTDLALVGVIGFNNRSCSAGLSFTPIVRFTNNGASSLTGFSVTLELTGPSTQNLTSFYSGTLAGSATDSLVFTTISGLLPGNYTWRAISQVVGDGNAFNDTLAGSFEVIFTQPNPTVFTTSPVVCAGSSVLLVADGTQNISWFSDPSLTVRVGGGDSVLVGPVSSATTFYVANDIGSTESAARTTYTATPNTTGNDWGLVFNVVNSPITIQTVDVFAVGAAGVISVRLTDNQGNTLATAGPFNYPSGGSTAAPTRVTLPVNLNVPVGAGFRLLSSAFTGGALIRETTGITYPIVSNSGNVSVTSGFINGVSQTYYWFYNWQVTSSSGCPGRDSVQVQVGSVSPTPDFLFNVNQSQVSFANMTNAGATYNWNFGDGVGTSTAANPVYNYTTTGTFNVTLNATNACAGPISAIKVVTIITLGGFADLQDNSTWAIYPNPVQDLFIVQLVQHRPGKLTITDVTGKVAYFELVRSDQDKVTVDVSGLNAGMYFVHYDTEGKRVTKRVVKY